MLSRLALMFSGRISGAKKLDSVFSILNLSMLSGFQVYHCFVFFQENNK